MRASGRAGCLAVSAVLLGAGAGCGSGMMDSELATQLLSVSPQGGATAVAPGSTIVLTFNRAMMTGTEQYVALHEGGVTGPSVPMACGWSDGRRMLTCRPNQPFASATRYTIHLGGGMMSADGLTVGSAMA